MHARSTTIKADPDNLDASIAFTRDEVMPAIQQIDGCIGLSMLTDREQFAQAMGARITDIAEMDLAVAHLRVPETV